MQVTKRKCIWSALLVAALTAGVLWIFSQSTSPTRMPTPNGATNEATHLLDSVLPTAAARPQPVSDSLPLLPPDADPWTVAVLMRPFAERGDPRAMYSLAMALKLCAAHQGQSEETMTDLAVRNAVSDAQSRKESGIEVEDSAVERDAAARASASIRTVSSCRSFSAKELKDWLRLLERAALAGESNAKREYARSALGEYAELPTAVMLTSEFNEVARRRSLAYRFGSELLAAHDCSSLRSLGVNAPDSVSAYVYTRAYHDRLRASTNLSGRARDEYFEVLASMEANLAARVPSGTLQSASLTSSHISSTYCK